MPHRRNRAAQHIKQVRTWRLYAPLPEPLRSALGRTVARESLLVQIVTDTGAEGWGEAAGPPGPTRAAVIELFAPILLGQDPMHVDVLWQRMWQCCQPWGRRGATIAAISALDIALWDLQGHVRNCPIHELMGGRYRDRFPCAAVGLYFREGPESERIPRLVDEARGYLDAGFRAVRVQLGRNLFHDIALVRALRAALPDTPLFADAHGTYDFGEALQVGRALDESAFFAFEEPVSMENPELLPRLGETLQTPILFGRAEQTRFGIRAILSGGGVSAITLDPTWCGGITEAQRIRAVSWSFGTNTLARISGTAIAEAAALHLLATDARQPGRLEASVPYLHRDGVANPLRDVLFSTNLCIADGVAQVPNGPGLGVVIDHEVLQSFCVETCVAE